MTPQQTMNMIVSAEMYLRMQPTSVLSIENGLDATEILDYAICRIQEQYQIIGSELIVNAMNRADKKYLA